MIQLKFGDVVFIVVMLILVILAGASYYDHRRTAKQVRKVIKDMEEEMGGNKDEHP